MMSLPQIISQMTPPIKSNTMARMMLVMILRFLDTGFFAFFDLGLSLVAWGSIGVSLAFSSPVVSSKLKA